MSKRSTSSNAVRHETRLSVEYPSPEQARRIERALAPEVGDIGDNRSRTRLRRSGAVVSIVVEAADLVALRAGLNTWCSLLGVAEQTGGAC
jgi:KEOPS complex subunit Pcc1